MKDGGHDPNEGPPSEQTRSSRHPRVQAHLAEIQARRANRTLEDIYAPLTPEERDAARRDREWWEAHLAKLLARGR